jgi:hypothetical protein
MDYRHKYKNIGSFSGTIKTPRYLTEIDGKKYALKTGGRNCYNERTATCIMDLFQIDHPTNFLDGEAILIEWIENAKTLNEVKILNDIQLFALFKIIVFDGYVGNWDRHGNNIIVKGDTLYAIDNEDIFYQKDKWIRLNKGLKKQLLTYIQKNQNAVNEYLTFIGDISIPDVFNEVFTSNFENKKVTLNSILNQLSCI